MASIGTEEVEILEPIGDVEDPARYRLAPRVNDLNGKILGLLSNRVANADLLIEKLKRLLTDRFNSAQVIVGGESELVDRCNAFVTGIGH